MKIIKKHLLAYLKLWDHSGIVDLDVLRRVVSLRALETSIAPHW